MGFLTGLIKGAVGVVTTPITILQDVVDVAQGETPTNTAEHLGTAIKDVTEGVEDLFDKGDVI